MTLVDRLRLARQYWRVLVASAVIGTIMGLAHFLTTPPRYQAMSQVFVNTHGTGDDLTALIQGSTFTQQRVTSYATLLTSPRMLQPVAEKLNLSLTAGQLAGMVTVSNPKGTVLLNITITDSQPERARDIANSIAEQFPVLVTALENPGGKGSSLVTASRTVTADAPERPISPSLPLDLILGGLGGLILGTSLALLRNALDRTIKSKEEAQILSGAPVMAMIGEDAEAERVQLVTQDSFAPRAEAFRQLRTNIRFLSVDHRLSSLVVTSAVAHEGKSTTASNLAITLAQAGESVVLIDADLRRPTIADAFALSSGVGLTTVLLGDLPVEEALQPWRDELPLRILTAGPIPPNPAELIGSARMAALITELTQRGITVVLDSPPLLPVTDAALLARATDGALVVTHAGKTHAEQLASACDALRIAGASVLGLVLNRLPRKRGSSYYGGYSYGGYHSYRSKQTPEATTSQVPEPAYPGTVLPETHAMPSAVPAERVQPEQPATVAWPVPVHPRPFEPEASHMTAPDPSTRVVLPSPTQLPDVVRAALVVDSSATSRMNPPLAAAPSPVVSSAPMRPRGRRVAVRPRAEQDFVIDADKGTATLTSTVNGSSWHAEWGDMPTLIAGPREGHHGTKGRAKSANGRHRN